MPAPLTVPFGNLASVGIGKETTFGTLAAPTIFHSIEDFSPKSEQILIPLTGARKHQGQRRPIIAGFKGTASMTPEPDVDTIGQLFVYAMGAQSAPALTAPSTTTTASATMGTAVLPVVSTTGFTVGQLVTPVGNSPTAIKSVDSATQMTLAANLTVTVANGGVVSLTATTAYNSTVTLGQLPSFTTELNRVTDAVDYLGCKIETMNLTFAKGKDLDVKFGLLFKQEQINASPASPVYSTKGVPTFENPSNISLAGGNFLGIGGITLHGASIALKNNLEQNYRPFGSRYPADFPQKNRDVTGTLQLGFESNALYQTFINNANTNTSVPINLGMYATDLADTPKAVQYGFAFNMNNCVLHTFDTAIKSTDLIYQSFTFTAAEVSSGSNDDLSILMTTGASAAY